MESQESWPPAAAITVLSGLAFIFIIWWWYFDIARGAAERHVASERETFLFNIWSYAHFPLYLAIAVVGVGIEHTISLREGSHLTTDHAGVLAGAAAVLMVALTVIGLTRSSAARRRSWGIFLICFATLPALFLGELSQCAPILYLTLVGTFGIWFNRLHLDPG